MNPLALLIVGSLVVGGGIMAFGKSKSILNAADNLIYKISSPKNIKIFRGKLLFGVDIQLINPSNVTFVIDFPFVNILYNGNSIGHTPIQNKNFSINKKSETWIKDINFEIDLLNKDVILDILPSLGISALSILKAWRSKNEAKQTEIINQYKSQVLSKFSLKMSISVNGIPINQEIKLA
jgi:hypothetical protein